MTPGQSEHSVETGSEILQQVCAAASAGDLTSARAVISENWPHDPTAATKRRYGLADMMAVFRRDGFIDRYSGARLMFPGALRLIHILLPEEFPFHPNWKSSETHHAFWSLFPTIDHIVPVARGGKDEFDNWVSTSQLRNSSKSNWLLEELGWTLHPAGAASEWDGMTHWFSDYVTDHPENLSDPYVARWFKQVS